MTRPYYAGSPDFGKIMASFNGPEYDQLSVAAAAGLSRLENERIKLLAQTQGLKELTDAQVARAKQTAKGQASYAEAQTGAATKMAFSDVLGSALGSIKMPGSGGDVFRDPTATDITIDTSTDTGSMLGETFKNNGGGLYWDSDMPENESILRSFPELN